VTSLDGAAEPSPSSHSRRDAVSESGSNGGLGPRSSAGLHGSQMLSSPLPSRLRDATVAAAAMDGPASGPDGGDGDGPGNGSPMPGGLLGPSRVARGFGSVGRRPLFTGSPVAAGEGGPGAAHSPSMLPSVFATRQASAGFTLSMVRAGPRLLASRDPINVFCSVS
jgi:hypothetical protein